MTEYETHGWATNTLNPEKYNIEKIEEMTEETKQKPDMIDHPFYYNRKNAIECIEEMELIYGPEAVMWFCLLNAHKYRYRSGLKNNGYEDLEKSDWYMNKYKELKEKIEANKPITFPSTNPWIINPTPMVTPTTTPNWWENPNYTITCNTKTTVASK